MQGSLGDTRDAIEAIEYAHSLGVRVINCSWDSTQFDKDLENTMRIYSDTIFVCSAGKSEDDLNLLPIFPACYDLPNIISVAAIDNQGHLYKYSGYGDSVDIAAPGVNIFCATPGNDYTNSSGTSVAAAYVTGVIALVMSVNPDLSVENIINIVKSSTIPLSSTEDKLISTGIIDSYSCVINEIIN